MEDKKRYTIIILSVLLGTLISAGLFLVKRNGHLGEQDITTIITNMVFALALVIGIGLFLKRKNNDDNSTGIK